VPSHGAEAGRSGGAAQADVVEAEERDERGTVVLAAHPESKLDAAEPEREWHQEGCNDPTTVFDHGPKAGHGARRKDHTFVFYHGVACRDREAPAIAASR
jgi:hypothetical protein